MIASWRDAWWQYAAWTTVRHRIMDRLVNRRRR